MPSVFRHLVSAEQRYAFNFLIDTQTEAPGLKARAPPFL